MRFPKHKGSGFHVGALAFAMLSGGPLCPGIGQVSSVSPSRLPLGQAWPPCCVQPSARGSGQKLATLLQMHPGRILHVLRTRSTEFAEKNFAPAPARHPSGEGDLDPENSGFIPLHHYHLVSFFYYIHEKSITGPKNVE